MQALIEQKNVKARKPYKCDYCGRIIVKGERYTTGRSIFMTDLSMNGVAT